MNKTEITVSTRTILRVIVVVVLAALFMRFLSSIANSLVLIAIAFFLALALNPVVSWISQHLKSKSRVGATGVAYLMVLAVLFGFLALIVPPFVSQTVDFVKDVPTTINDFKNQDTSLGRAIRQYKIDEQIDRFNSDLSSKVSNVSRPVFATAGRVLGTAASILIVLVLTFMMLVEGPAWIEKILALQPTEKRAHRKKLAYRMYRVVTGYVNGQLLIAVIAGVFACVALFILSSIFDAHINAIALAGIVTLFGLIPMIGNTLAALMVVLFCLFASVPLAIAVAIYFLIYQQVENVTLQPYIQSRSNQLTPLIVFIAALLGASVGGLMGALFAIPVAGCAKIIIDDRLNHRQKAEQPLKKKAA